MSIRLLPVVMIVTVVLVALKLFGALAWSWWATTSPAWGYLLFCFCFAFYAACVMMSRHGK